MADLSFYQHAYGIRTPDAAFAHFCATLQNYYDANFYVDWGKVYARIEQFRPELFLLSSLCGIADKEQAARELLRNYPQVIRVLPTLIACRRAVQMLEDASSARVTTYDFPATNTAPTDAEIERYVRFLASSGVLALLERITSVPDYMTGVEVGMDTNGRKNRGGCCGENAVAPFIAAARDALLMLEHKAQATFDFLTAQGCRLPPEFRGVVWDHAFWVASPVRRFAVMEVNHYGGSGSKPPAIAREYVARQVMLDAAGVGLLWVTDGIGWLDMRNPLREAFSVMPHIINIRLASEGQLEWTLRRLLLQGAHLKEVAA